MANQAKWHKSCHLKFVSSKLLRVKGKKRKLEVPSSPEKGSKRQSTSTSERVVFFVWRLVEITRLFYHAASAVSPYV